MSRYFVNDPPVAVPEFDTGAVISDAPPNVIYIKSRMDIETRGKVKNELVGLAADGKSPEIRLGEQDTALLIHNIVKWAGPDFDGVPCDAAHIRTLDPNEPHIEKVLAAINDRNLRKAAPNPKPPIEPGFVINGSHDANPASAGGISHQLATSIPPSVSRSVLAGRLHKSDNLTPTTSTNSLED